MIEPGIFVTGATGKTGGAVATGLLRAGYRVRALVHREDGRSASRGYAFARQDPVVLYSPPFWTHHVTAALMLPVFPLLLAPYFPGRIRATLKHPMLVGVMLWAVAHLISNGMLADVVLFGGFLLWAVADRISYSRRTPRPLRGAPPARRNDVIVVLAGLALYGLFVLWLHQKLIGVQPFPL